MAILSLHSASSGLSALDTKLEVIANNIANAGTQGFKGSRVMFEDLMYQEREQPGTQNVNGDIRPTGVFVGLGTKVSGTQLDFRQGGMESTGRTLDFTIQGSGFFAVQVEDGLGLNGLAYTRAGNFALNANRELVVANSNGRRLVPAITIPEDVPEESITVTADGIVSFVQNGQTQEAGQLELTIFPNTSGLQPVGENLFVETTASGQAINTTPTENGAGNILQGFLEASNVDPTKELINLIRTQRLFEMNSQSIQAADELLREVANLRRG